MNSSLHQNPLPNEIPSSLTAEAIAAAARINADNSGHTVSEFRADLGAHTISRESLISAGLEIGISRSEMEDALRSVAARIETEDRKINRRLELGISLSASQVELEGEIGVRTVVDDVLRKFQEYADQVIEGGKESVFLGYFSTKNPIIAYDFSAIGLLRSLRGFFVPTPFKIDQIKSPALRELCDVANKLGLGINVEQNFLSNFSEPKYLLSLRSSPGVFRTTKIPEPRAME